MKNLQALGAYIDNLIKENAEGVANKAAKKVHISAGELHAIRTGVRKSPSPEILQKIATKLDGDYGLMMGLAGYTPPDDISQEITVLPVVEVLIPGNNFDLHIVGAEKVFREWACCPRDHFIFRYPFHWNSAYHIDAVVCAGNEWADNDYVLVSIEKGPAMVCLAFHTPDGGAILAPYFEPSRIVNTKEYFVFGITKLSVIKQKRMELYPVGEEG